ncbi:S-adenosyl-l-methionine hydroxide adenosyltransferase family protein [Dactylosporangium sp. NPDC051541]|uniref:S-adenosyl-l-methionine hydroxide adenosyltransferase family protein n=1 Tax=Dactylosporangium sp. NPDC051541 TaxID=3363977 RepID=UPI00379491BD
MISFTTDYGLSDGFVAACHGVLARLAPTARVIDITHLIPPGDVRRGAAVLAQTAPSLPVGVHLAVVDPGVGTARRAVALSTRDGSILVGPDNGLLLPAAEALGGVAVAVHLTNAEWFAPKVSATFHGRDIFAPVAARLATGSSLREAGPEIADLLSLPPSYVEQAPGRLTAAIQTIDHFGNVQLAAPAELLPPLPESVRVNGVPAVHATTFGDAEPDSLVVFADSAGFVAVAVNGGNAAARLALTAESRVTIMY